MHIEIVIPTYRRPVTAIRAIKSALPQLTCTSNLMVTCRVCEDGASIQDFDEICRALPQSETLLIYRRNTNLGMSKNIYEMIQESKADYIVLLSDDDILESDAVGTVLGVIEREAPDIIFGPRPAYTNPGNLYTISSLISRDDRSIQGTPFNAAYYSYNFFILSGLVIRRQSIDFQLWRANIQNAFFPIIFGFSALKGGCATYCRTPLVQHTVMNEVFWAAWGKSDEDQQIRLFTDWFASLDIIAKTDNSKLQRIYQTIATIEGRSQNILNQILFIASSRRARSTHYYKTYLGLLLTRPVNLMALAALPISLLLYFKTRYLKTQLIKQSNHIHDTPQ